MAKVFVYGTLREDKSKKTPPFILFGYKLFAYPGGNFSFPYITKTGDTEDKVYGEVLNVNDEQLAELDKYEGVDRGMYSRETVGVVSVTTQAPVKVFVYVEKSLHPKAIPTGNWFRRS